MVHREPLSVLMAAVLLWHQHALPCQGLLISLRRDFLLQSSSALLSTDTKIIAELASLPEKRSGAEWTATELSRLTLEQAATSDSDVWAMARWPDPILRQSAAPVSREYFGTDLLRRACQLLVATATREGAVGLAAEQCGVDARIIYLRNTQNVPWLGNRVSTQMMMPLVMGNPMIVGRSPEAGMVVWREHCLVLPPSFSATVLRDAWVDVEYQDITNGEMKRIRLFGEPARCFQHEFDHDRGILITDHIGLDEMQNSGMKAIESEGHESRMALAYSRHIDVGMVA